MEQALIRLVWERAHSRCEYCLLPHDASILAFEIDHIIAQKHEGPTRASNLALACFYCNSFKGPNLSGIDPLTKKITNLFNPRRHKWEKHFRYEGAVLVGLTPVGRATIQTLNINNDDAMTLREGLIAEGRFPPDD